MKLPLKTVLVLLSLAAASLFAQPAPAGGAPAGGGNNPQVQPDQGQARGQGGAGRQGGGGRGRGVGIYPPIAGRASPHDTISANVMNRVISITYGRPYSKSPTTGEMRVVWGSLVPWNDPWRLGADEATLLLTPVDLIFGGTTIPAGAYTLYMVPVQEGNSLLAISRNVGKWGVGVDTTADVARIPLTKASLSPANEQLTLAFEAVPAAAPAPAAPTIRLKIMWEATQYSVEFQPKL